MRAAGWLMTRRLWGELGPKWPNEKGFWDDWLREPPQVAGLPPLTTHPTTLITSRDLARPRLSRPPYRPPPISLDLA